MTIELGAEEELEKGGKIKSRRGFLPGERRVSFGAMASAAPLAGGAMAS